jgi:hypothetical protein
LRNLERAKTAVAWIRRMLAARDEAAVLRKELETASHRPWFRSRS